MASPKSYASVGLLYCGIDTTQPGTYTVTFTASNDNSASVSVQRTVVVLPSCNAGEQACSDGTCGAGEDMQGGRRGLGIHVRRQHQSMVTGAVFLPSLPRPCVTLLGHTAAEMCGPSPQTHDLPPLPFLIALPSHLFPCSGNVRPQRLHCLLVCGILVICRRLKVLLGNVNLRFSGAAGPAVVGTGTRFQRTGVGWCGMNSEGCA